MRKRVINICNIYASLWLIMNLKGLVYSADIVSVVAYIIIVAISLYYAVMCFMDSHNLKFVKIYNVLFALLVVYGVLNLFMGDVDSHLKIPRDFYLQNVVKSMLPFYAFFAFAKKGMITKRWLCYFGIIFLLVSIGGYYASEVSLAERYSLEENEFTNNAGYIFVAIIPLCLFFNKSKILQYLMLATCGFFILSSFKRGAILTGAICILMFIMSTFDKRMGYKQVLVLVLTAALFVIGYKFVFYLMENNAFFVSRLDATMEGYTSGRDVLFEHYWNMFWTDSSILSVLFGHGADATIRSGYNYAHNDWLEILINQGIVGIVVFLVFWIYFFKMWRRFDNSIIKVAFGMCFVTLFLKTVFSMSINDMTIYSTLIIGLGAASYKNDDVLTRLTT